MVHCSLSGHGSLEPTSVLDENVGGRNSMSSSEAGMDSGAVAPEFSSPKLLPL